VIDKVIEEILESELLAQLQGRISDIDINANTINAQRIRLDGIAEVVDALKLIEGVPIATFLKQEQTARIEGDTALAQTIDLIGAKSGDGLSFALDLTKVKVSPTESLGTRLQGIDTSLGDNLAAIAAEQTARTTALASVASQLQTLTAITEENAAAITNESTARANADGSLAQQISTLHSTVNGHTASIQTVQQVTDGLKAQYMVKTDVNGYVSGFGLYNQGSSAQFIILADRFALVTPGRNPQVPFSVDANGVYMNNAYIRNLTVDKVTGGNILSQWNINSANGRIVLDTGTHMKVLGVGFGANGDLIEWYGPKMAVTSCAKANAITYVGTDGSAYFGGALSAGTLHSAGKWNISGTDPWAENTVAILQHNNSTGRPKTVVASYTGGMHARATFQQNEYQQATAWVNSYNPARTGSFELVLLRNGVELTRWTLTSTSGTSGPEWIDYVPPVYECRADHGFTGARTVTDNFTGTGTVTYTLRIISRSGQFFNNGNYPGLLSISVVEQP
jgi:hypothetical protein